MPLGIRAETKGFALRKVQFLTKQWTILFFFQLCLLRPEEIKSIQSQFSKNINQKIPDFSHQNS